MPNHQLRISAGFPALAPPRRGRAPSASPEASLNTRRTYSGALRRLAAYLAELHVQGRAPAAGGEARPFGIGGPRGRPRQLRTGHDVAATASESEAIAFERGRLAAVTAGASPLGIRQVNRTPPTAGAAAPESGRNRLAAAATEGQPNVVRLAAPRRNRRCHGCTANGWPACRPCPMIRPSMYGWRALTTQSQWGLWSCFRLSLALFMARSSISRSTFTWSCMAGPPGTFGKSANNSSRTPTRPAVVRCSGGRSSSPTNVQAIAFTNAVRDSAA